MDNMATENGQQQDLTMDEATENGQQQDLPVDGVKSIENTDHDNREGSI